MKTFLPLLFILSSLFLYADESSSPAEKSIDLFILAGQSNAQGWQGDGKAYPADPEGLDSAIPLYWISPGISDSGKEWTHLKPQDGRFPSGHFGLEVTFARNLERERRQGYRSSNTAIFKYTLGSTSIATFWKTPGEGGHYDKMLIELKSSIELLEKEGSKVNVAGFIWIQGESDAQTPEMAEAYGDRLQSIINDLRKSLGECQLPVILGVDEQHPWVKKNIQVLEAQIEIAKADPFTQTTSLIGLAKADSTHLTPEGLMEQGQRVVTIYHLIVPFAQESGR